MKSKYLMKNLCCRTRVGEFTAATTVFAKGRSDGPAALAVRVTVCPMVCYLLLK